MNQSSNARVFSSFLLLVVVFTTSALSTDNLVINGDFEAVAADGSPEGWDRFKKHFASLQEEDGNTFLRITSKKMGNQPTVTQQIDLPGGVEQLRISVRMRTINITTGPEAYHNPRVQLSQQDANGKNIAYGASPRLIEDSDWQTLTIEDYRIVDGAVSFGVGCGFNNSTGIADFDDLVVEAVGGAPAAAEPTGTPVEPGGAAPEPGTPLGPGA